MAYITIYDYLAYSRPETQNAVVEIMRSKGYTINPRNAGELSSCIRKFASHMGVEQAMPLLATVHPDRELILDSVEPATMGADGSFSTQQPATSNEQPAIRMNSYPESNTQTTHLIIAGLLSIALLGTVAVILKS